VLIDAVLQERLQAVPGRLQRVSEEYDIQFSSGTLHFVPEPLRQEIFGNHKGHTVSGGINAFSLLVEKPFIAKAPDSDASAKRFVSGELFTYYHDWKIELCNEAIAASAMRRMAWRT
jgi:tellurite methyltransferase